MTAGIEEEVVFHSNNQRLAGVLHRPAVTPRAGAPGIVVSGGFGGVKELRVPIICAALAAAGYVALRFDYQGFGASEGIRWRLIPLEQAQNIRDAVTLLECTDGVDPARLALYGNGWGGAPALVAAASDPRVRCLVCTATPSNGERWMRGMRSESAWNTFTARVATDRRARVLTGVSETVASDEIMIPDPRTHQEHGKSDANVGNQWRPCLPLASAEAVIDFQPEREVDRVSPRPLLLIHCEHDALIPLEHSQRLYERASQPKELLVISGAEHHDIYYSPWREQAMDATLTWYGRHL